MVMNISFMKSMKRSFLRFLNDKMKSKEQCKCFILLIVFYYEIKSAYKTCDDMLLLEYVCKVQSHSQFISVGMEMGELVFNQKTRINH